jgi:hypothetical protein
MQIKFLFYIIILFLLTTTISAQGIINKTVQISYYHNQIEWRKFNGFAISGELYIQRKRKKKTQLMVGIQYKQTHQKHLNTNLLDTVKVAMENPIYPIWPYERTLLTKELSLLLGLNWKIIQRKKFGIKTTLGIFNNYFIQYSMHGKGYIPVSPISPNYLPGPFSFRYSYRGKGGHEIINFCSFASIELNWGSPKNNFSPLLFGQISKDILYENWCYLIGIGVRKNK